MPDFVRRQRLLIAAMLAVGLFLGLIRWRFRAGTESAARQLEASEKLAALAPALTRPRVDFSGRWRLDKKASDPIDEMLEARGRSFFERKIAANMAMTLLLTQTELELSIELQTPLLKHSDRIPLDGTSTVIKDLQGKPVEVVARWSDDGESLIIEGELPQDGKSGVFRSTRSLADDGNTMNLLVEYDRPDKPNLRTRQVFRRLPD